MDALRARRRLEEERDRLLGLRGQAALEGASEAGHSARSELSTHDQHPADQGTETVEREQSQSLLEQVETSLKEVDHALRRVAEGTYGRCEACGRPIGDDRLDARPATRYCVEDQTRREREALPPTA
jgi:RNA polymerase-binding transcription factor DksA